MLWHGFDNPWKELAEVSIHDKLAAFRGKNLSCRKRFRAAMGAYEVPNFGNSRLEIV